MARRIRFFSSDATYHVMFRGNNGQSIFSSGSDCREFCLLIKEGVELYKHRILAFCFMSNHVHLAIQSKDVSISKICQNLCFRYTRFYHYRHNTTGYLFQGRFKSILIDDNIYLKELVRYIHLNPVRAQMVENPLDYRWSSHQAYLTNQESTWLDTSRVLQIFGQSEREAKEAFNRFVLSGIGENEKIDFESGFSDGVVGSDMFIEEPKIKSEGFQKNNPQSIDLTKLIYDVANWYKVDIEMLKVPGLERRMAHIRAMIALLIKDIPGMNLRELSTIFGRSDSSMSQAASRLEARIKGSNDLKTEFVNAREKVLGTYRGQA